MMVGGSCIMGIWETLSGQKEEKTAIENLEEQMDDCCPSLSWTQVLTLPHCTLQRRNLRILPRVGAVTHHLDTQ